MPFSRLTRGWLAASGLCLIGAISGCKSTRSDVPPGRPFSAAADAAPPVQFSSEPAPPPVNSTAPAPYGNSLQASPYGNTTPPTPAAPSALTPPPALDPNPQPGSGSVSPK